MKKISLILAIVTMLALILTGCSLSFNPPLGPPQVPQPAQPQPGQPQPGQPQPGQPLPGQPQPGQPQPGQPQPGQPQPGQPPQPPTPQGPQPGQSPVPAQPTATKKSGGGSPVATPTATLILGQIIQLDLEATDLYVDSGKFLHIGVKNNSTQSGNITFGVSCTGTWIDSKGLVSSKLSYSASSLTYPFNANQERWTNTNIKLDKGDGLYNLTCTISLLLDPNVSNNSVTKPLTIP